jgi:hypothetical protein
MTKQEVLNALGKEEKDIESAATKVCGYGECICGYNGCNHSNRMSSLPTIGNDTCCPMEKYNITPQKNRLISMDSILDDTDLFLLCANCDYAKVVETNNGEELELERTDEEYQAHCMDCPVQMCRDNMVETMAEAMMS